MKPKERSVSWTRTLYLLVALVLVSLALILLSQGPTLQPVESAVGTVLSPIQQAVSDVTSTVGSWIDGLSRAHQLEEENKSLRTALDAVTAENAVLHEQVREIDQLRQLLKFQDDRPEIQGIIARNIGGDPSGLTETITVNRGSNNGVAVGMPVVSPGGILIGQVSDVKGDRATVLLITDVSSSIPVATQRTQTPGVITGQWQTGGRLLLQHIPRDTDVKNEDIVLTSGLGGTFPSGLLVAQVYQVHQNDVQMEKDAEAVPLAELSSLENVLIITNASKK